MAKRISKDVELPIREVEQLSVGDATESAIINASSYFNNHRALANVNDGCKPSYRRLIWSAMQFPKGELQPSVQVINDMASYHPHDLSAINPLLGAMVRSGVFTGKGSFGVTSITGEERPPAAPRYTKSRLSDLYYDILKPQVQCMNLVESPIGPLEPEKLGFIFPLCLYFRGLVSGIGYGISTIYPCFSPRSLYQAYIHNDPNLLEPNVDLLLDKRNSELKKLWKTGKGRVIYSYKLSPYTNQDGKQGFLFEGDTSIFTPNLRHINKLVEQGHVFIDDLTDMQGPKMFVGLVSGRGYKLDDLEKLCRQCCYDATVYQLNVTDGKTAFRIPLYDWLDYTYKNYINLVMDVNQKKIEKVKFDIDVQEALPVISDYILNKNPKATDEELVKVLKISKEIVDSVMQKPISYLRKNKDTTDRLKTLKEKLKELKSFDPVKYAEELIEKL